MPANPATEAYRAARDQILALRGDHGRALDEFDWPRFDGPFNWAVDWFDAVGRDNGAIALHIVEEDGREATCSFGDLVRRSGPGGRLAWRRGSARRPRRPHARQPGGAVGVDARGDEARRGDHADHHRPRSGRPGGPHRARRRRHVVVNASDAGKFDAVPGDYTRIAVGEAPDGVAGLRGRRAGRRRPGRPPGHAGRRSAAPVLHQRDDERPKLVEHTQVSYPVGHLSTMYWLGLQPGDVHLNISSPGWAKHAWSCFFAPWIAEATVYLYNYTRFDPAALLDRMRRDRITTFCAPPTVWRMLIQADLSAGARLAARGRRRRRAAQPRGHRAGEGPVGAHLARRLRPDRDDGVGGQHPRPAVKPGSMGRPLPGMPVVLVDPVSGQPADEGEIWLDLSGPPLAMMTGYQAIPRAERRGDGATATTTPATSRAGRRGLHHLHRARRRRLQGQRLQDQPVRAGERADRAPGGRRGRGRSGAGPGAGRDRRPTSPSRRATSRRGRPRSRSCVTPGRTWRRSSGCAGSSSPSCPRRSSGKIRRVELRQREEEPATGGSPTEFSDADFPELRMRRARARPGH